MLNQWTIMLAHERTLELVKEASDEGRLRDLLGETDDRTPFYAPALDHLGHLLIEAGLNLRSRYGRLEWQMTTHEATR